MTYGKLSYLPFITFKNVDPDKLFNKTEFDDNFIVEFELDNKSKNISVKPCETITNDEVKLTRIHEHGNDYNELNKD